MLSGIGQLGICDKQEGTAVRTSSFHILQIFLHLRTNKAQSDTMSFLCSSCSSTQQLTGIRPSALHIHA